MNESINQSDKMISHDTSNPPAVTVLEVVFRFTLVVSSPVTRDTRFFTSISSDEIAFLLPLSALSDGLGTLFFGDVLLFVLLNRLDRGCLDNNAFWEIIRFGGLLCNGAGTLLPTVEGFDESDAATLLNNGRAVTWKVNVKQNYTTE